MIRCARLCCAALEGLGAAAQDFLRNNRGINDGGDLDPEFMEALYLRIVHNEIKMKARSRHCHRMLLAIFTSVSRFQRRVVTIKAKHQCTLWKPI